MHRQLLKGGRLRDVRGLALAEISEDWDPAAQVLVVEE